MRQLRGVDFSAYGQAFALLFRFPQAILGPFVAGIVSSLVLFLIPATGGGVIDSITAGIAQLLAQVITFFGLAFAMIAADALWRGRRTTLAQTWDDAQRKIGDIFFATIGFGFVIYVAGIVGGSLGAFGAIALSLVATFFFIYTLPAAAIGGIPGSAGLQVSLERAKDNPLPTLFVTLLYIVINVFAPTQIINAILPLMFSNPLFANPIVPTILESAIVSIFNTYLAFVLAKTYSDLAFGRRRW